MILLNKMVTLCLFIAFIYSESNFFSDSIYWKEDRKIEEFIHLQPQAENSSSIDGKWLISEKFAERGPYEKPTKILCTITVEKNDIQKYCSNALVLQDSLFLIQRTESYEKYTFKTNKKDFILHLKKPDQLRLFIGGQDGTREIYYRTKK